MKRVQPVIGKTYMMITTEPRTIIFKFVNIGVYEVNGKIVNVRSHSDLGSPYPITDITEYKSPKS